VALGGRRPGRVNFGAVRRQRGSRSFPPIFEFIVGLLPGSGGHRRPPACRNRRAL
jgi:hypothetical protein